MSLASLESGERESYICITKRLYPWRKSRCALQGLYLSYTKVKWKLIDTMGLVSVGSRYKKRLNQAMYSQRDTGFEGITKAPYSATFYKSKTQPLKIILFSHLGWPLGSCYTCLCRSRTDACRCWRGRTGKACPAGKGHPAECTDSPVSRTVRQTL